MKKKNLKPILGCELYVCKEDDHRREAADPDSKYNHLLILAENEAGYRNLVRLTSEAALHGFYKKPRISKKFLASIRRDSSAFPAAWRAKSRST